MAPRAGIEPTLQESESCVVSIGLPRHTNSFSMIYQNVGNFKWGNAGLGKPPFNRHLCICGGFLSAILPVLAVEVPHLLIYGGFLFGISWFGILLLGKFASKVRCHHKIRHKIKDDRYVTAANTKMPAEWRILQYFAGLLGTSRIISRVNARSARRG